MSPFQFRKGKALRIMVRSFLKCLKTKSISLETFARIILFLVGFCLTLWQSYVCLQKYLRHPLGNEVLFVSSADVENPAYILCPAYSVAFNLTAISELGIGSVQDYKNGDWRGNHTQDERKNFAAITYDIEDVLDTLDIRFNGRSPDKLLSGSNISQKYFTTKYHRHFGRCYELNVNGLLDQDSIYTLKFKVKLPAYIHIKQTGQFYENSRSRLEIGIGKCLFIELTYNIFKRHPNTKCHVNNSTKNDCGCKIYQEKDTYDDCTEGEVEKDLIENFQCAVPYLTSQHGACSEKVTA